ncbi:MAG: hypothetical protein M0013_02260 [Actinomycetota bacterium]|nr:hypothetical protein [Actinomycetota bacterium]
MAAAMKAVTAGTVLVRLANPSVKTDEPLATSDRCHESWSVPQLISEKPITTMASHSANRTSRSTGSLAASSGSPQDRWRQRRPVCNANRRSGRSTAAIGPPT